MGVLRLGYQRAQAILAQQANEKRQGDAAIAVKLSELEQSLSPDSGWLKTMNLDLAIREKKLLLVHVTDGEIASVVYDPTRDKYRISSSEIHIDDGYGNVQSSVEADTLPIIRLLGGVVFVKYECRDRPKYESEFWIRLRDLEG